MIPFENGIIPWYHKLPKRTRGRKRSFLPEEEKIEERIPRERRQRQSIVQKKPKSEDLRTECATCKGTGDNENLVREFCQTEWLVLIAKTQARYFDNILVSTTDLTHEKAM
ncbi:UNVERIFIED_CONTAM: hypothetical protein K2H54_035525 [Gekko kuhli]